MAGDGGGWRDGTSTAVTFCAGLARGPPCTKGERGSEDGGLAGDCDGGLEDGGLAGDCDGGLETGDGDSGLEVVTRGEAAVARDELLVLLGKPGERLVGGLDALRGEAAVALGDAVPLGFMPASRASRNAGDTRSGERVAAAARRTHHASVGLGFQCPRSCMPFEIARVCRARVRLHAILVPAGSRRLRGHY